MAMLDTAAELVTAEGCALTLRRAGPVVRARAWLIDSCVRAGIMMVAAPVLASFGALGVGTMLLLAFGLEWLYPMVFEVLWHGATPGKRVTRLMVLSADGTPVNWSSSAVRNLMRAIDYFPVLYGVGLCTMLMGDGTKRLGDFVAGTVVVYRDDVSPMPVLQSASAVAPTLALHLDEQRALIEFVRRDATFTPARSEELAGMAGSLTGGLAPAAARAYLLSIGRYLLGQR
jgi:uncharacterized RDD family membrane protein YckC